MGGGEGGGGKEGGGEGGGGGPHLEQAPSRPAPPTSLRPPSHTPQASVEEEVATDTLSIAPTAAASLGDATVATCVDPAAGRRR